MVFLAGGIALPAADLTANGFPPVYPNIAPTAITLIGRTGVPESSSAHVQAWACIWFPGCTWETGEKRCSVGTDVPWLRGIPGPPYPTWWDPSEGDVWADVTGLAPGTYTGLLYVEGQGYEIEAAVCEVVLQVLPPTFPDVPVGFWALGQIEACFGAGIVQGYPDGLYRPDEPVTRDQMAVYISRAMAGGEDNVPPARYYPTPSFGDVPFSHWAYKYIEYVAANGVVAGYQGKHYEPGNPVTRDQLAVYIARSAVELACRADLSCYDPPPTPTFPDVAVSSWAYSHIEYCVEHGVVNGYEDGLYHPEIVVTRDQMAVYIARAFGLL
jgi:hypothetical protein